MNLPPGTRLRIRQKATAEEIVAVLLALDQAAAAEAALPPRPLRWQRAARLESLGGAPLTSASDPRLRSLPATER